MNKINLKVNGMVCGGCENRVKNAIQEIEGVENVTADHTTGNVEIETNKDIERSVIENTIEDIGFEVVKED